METPIEVPWAMIFFLVVIGVIVVMLIAVRSRRRNALRGGGLVCSSCSERNPPFAQFCRRCGTRL